MNTHYLTQGSLLMGTVLTNTLVLTVEKQSTVVIQFPEPLDKNTPLQKQIQEVLFSRIQDFFNKILCCYIFTIP